MFEFLKRKFKKTADKSQRKPPFLPPSQTRKRSSADSGALDWMTLAPLAGIPDADSCDSGPTADPQDHHHGPGHGHSSDTNSADPGTPADGHHHGGFGQDVGGHSHGGGSDSFGGHSGSSHSCSSHSCGGHSG
jgi:hypothetical protein